MNAAYFTIILQISTTVFPKLGDYGSAIAYLPGFVCPGPSFRILDWACYRQTPLWHFFILNYDILKGIQGFAMIVIVVFVTVH